MKRFFLQIFVILIFINISFSQEFLAFSFKRNSKENRLYFYTHPYSSVSCIGTKIPIGSYLDPQGQNGMANIFKYFMLITEGKFKGENELLYLTSIGGEMDSYIKKDYILTYTIFPYFYTDSVFWLETKRVIIEKKDLRRKIFERAKALALEDAIIREKTRTVLDDILRDYAFGKGNPFSKREYGIPNEIRRIEFSDFIDFVYRYYSPADSKIYVSGSFDITDASRKYSKIAKILFKTENKIKKRFYKSVFTPGQKRIKKGLFSISIIYKLPFPKYISEYVEEEFFYFTLSNYIRHALIKNSLIKSDSFFSRLIITRGGIFTVIYIKTKSYPELQRIKFAIEKELKKLKSKRMKGDVEEEIIAQFRLKKRVEENFCVKRIETAFSMENILGEIYPPLKLERFVSKMTGYDFVRLLRKFEKEKLTVVTSK